MAYFPASVGGGTKTYSATVTNMPCKVAWGSMYQTGDETATPINVSTDKDLRGHTIQAVYVPNTNTSVAPYCWIGNVTNNQVSVYLGRPVTTNSFNGTVYVIVYD